MAKYDAHVPLSDEEDIWIDGMNWFVDKVRAAQGEASFKVWSCLGCWHHVPWLWCLQWESFPNCNQSIAIKWEEETNLH